MESSLVSRIHFTSCSQAQEDLTHVQSIGLCSRRELQHCIQYAECALENVTTNEEKVRWDVRLNRLRKGFLVQACQCRNDIWEFVHEACLERWQHMTHNIKKCPQCSAIYSVPKIPEPDEDPETPLEDAWCKMSPGDTAREDNQVFDLLLDQTKAVLAQELNHSNKRYKGPGSMSQR